MPSPRLARHTPSILSLTLAAALLPAAGRAHGFTTVINVPPDVSPVTIGSDTQLNLFDGGSIPDLFEAGAPGVVSTDVEVNIHGGTVGAVFNTYAGSTINMNAGTAGAVFTANKGSVINLAGGIIGERADLLPFSTLNMTGGSVGYQFDAQPDSQLNITGGEFLLNGFPIAGLGSPGDSMQLNLPDESRLTGTLLDGSVFVFNKSLWGVDTIADGVLTLNVAALPPAAPAIITAPTDPVPNGLRSGQTLHLGAGAEIGDHFAAVDATLNINQGTVGIGLEIVDSTVTMTGGSIGRHFKVYGHSTVNVAGGTVDNNFHIRDTSTLNISGAAVLDSTIAFPGGTINMSDGVVERLIAFDQGTLHVSGGNVLHAMHTYTDSSASLYGGEFELDGVPLDVSAAPGGTMGVDVPAGSILTGTLADGTVIVLSELDRNPNLHDEIADGTLKLVSATIPLATPSVINVPTDTVPIQLRAGQTLNLTAGGTTPDGLKAINTTLNLTGGTVGHETEVYGSTVTLNGAAIGDNFDLYQDSDLTIHSGSIGQWMDITSGSTVTINGGSIGGFVRVGDVDNYGAPAVLNVQGGSVGNTMNAFANTTVNVTGGTIGSGFDAQDGSTVNIDGGAIGNTFDAYSGSTVTLNSGSIGYSARAYAGSQVTVNGGTVGGLTALEDAEVQINGGDHGLLGASGGHLYLNDGLVDDVSATNDGIVTMFGGAVGALSTGDGGIVSIENGTIATAAIQSSGTLNVSGNAGVGQVALFGGVVDQVGGTVGDDVSLFFGSRYHLSGGTVGDGFQASGGSFVNIYGASFVLDGVDLTPGLTPGAGFTIDSRDVTLEGILTDGSSFSFDLNAIATPGSDYFDLSMFLTIQLAPLIGDLDGDGFVGIYDLNLVLTNWNQTVTAGDHLLGDPSGDGFVGIHDLNTVLSHWNNGTPPGAATAIPEPTTLGVISVLGCLLLRRR